MKPKCCFITPQILEHMARTGPDVRTSLIISHDVRSDREGISFLDIMKSATTNPDLAAVNIWDSHNTYDQRVELIHDPLSSKDPVIAHAAKFATFTRDYLSRTFSRNGLDGRGTTINVNVHFGDAYLNAFWDGFDLTLGDGDGRVFTSFANSIDVMAHEMGHGVVETTAGLIYQGESGALNEHFADVFGILTQVAFRGSPHRDWLIGDEIMPKSLRGEALRSMAYPGNAYDNPILGKDSQPNNMLNKYTGSADHGGVHINSGIFNKLFYLVSKDIGIYSAGYIWYATLLRLWPTAQFADAAAVLIDQAKRMAGGSQVKAGAPQSLRKALQTIGFKF